GQLRGRDAPALDPINVASARRQGGFSSAGDYHRLHRGGFTNRPFQRHHASPRMPTINAAIHPASVREISNTSAIILISTAKATNDRTITMPCFRVIATLASGANVIIRSAVS